MDSRGNAQRTHVQAPSKNPVQKEMQMTTFGYARVSTDGQELDSQLDALKAAGAVKVFKEKESGIKTDRKELARAIAALDKGDVLLVTRLDRLARSTLDLLNTLE
jgi:DNA invertase Pin-like site-specific DNA recombinase